MPTDTGPMVMDPTQIPDVIREALRELADGRYPSEARCLLCFVIPNPSEPEISAFHLVTGRAVTTREFVLAIRSLGMIATQGMGSVSMSSRPVA